jgi:hypothetical protein
MKVLHKFDDSLGLFFASMIFAGTLFAQEAVTSPLLSVPSSPTAYYIRIVSPEPEETFQNSIQNLRVTLQVTPDLESQDNIQMYVDGQPVGAPQHALSIELPWLPRGSHRLQAKVIQQNGPGAETDTITIFQQRTSVNLRAN